MIIIKNTSKSTKVLKAKGMVDLRIFPGHNNVSIGPEELEKYFKSKAAIGVAKESLKIDVDIDSLSDGQKKQAKAAQVKNDKMNEAQKVIKKQNEMLANAGTKETKQENLIKELGETNAAQSVLLKEQGDLMAEMRKELDAMKKEPKPKSLKDKDKKDGK